MLSVLLETMHEDLNSVTIKPYIEQQDSNGRPDQIVAQEFWDGLMKRDNSIFVKYFYGQLKSRLRCLICKNISITFDPYNVLSVPIPKTTYTAKLNIKYYPLDFSKPVLNIALTLSSERAQISEVKEKVKDAVAQYLREEGEDPDEALPPIVCISKDKKVEQMAQSKIILSEIEKGYSLVALEREKHESIGIQPI